VGAGVRGFKARGPCLEGRSLKEWTGCQRLPHSVKVEKSAQQVGFTGFVVLRSLFLCIVPPTLLCPASHPLNPLALPLALSPSFPVYTAMGFEGLSTGAVSHRSRVTSMMDLSCRHGALLPTSSVTQQEQRHARAHAANLPHGACSMFVRCR
jgi:hypothetical protein